MRSADLLVDGFDRIREAVHDTVNGLSSEELAWRPGGRANSIGWLIWHLTRVQDDHLAAAAGHGQLWTDQGWADRFELPLDRAATGYGHTSAQVALVRMRSPELLVGYHEAVYGETVSYVTGLTDLDLDRIVDESWDPPVTLGVRLVSVLSDDLQHAGQAALIRGLIQRRRVSRPRSRRSSLRP